METELAIVAGRIDLLLARARSASTIAQRRHALDSLARGLLLADPGAVDEATRAAALALRVDPSTVSAAAAPRQPHAVDAPLVLDRRGLVRQVFVTYDPIGLGGDGGVLGFEARQACARAIERACREAPGAHDPAAHRLTLAQPAALARARVDGPSLAAAAFVSATSLFTGRPTRDGVVVTGGLNGDAITSVGATRQKVMAARARGARLLVVPEADYAVARAHAEDLSVRGVSTTEQLLEAALRPATERAAPDVEMARARAAFSTGWEGYRWPTVRDSLASLAATLPDGRVDLQVEALTRLAAATRHLGDPVGSEEWLEQAHELALTERGRRGVPDAPLSYLWLQTAMTRRQLGRLTEAARAAKRAAKVARRARLRGELIKALGCVGLVARSRGRIDDAIAAFTESLEVQLELAPGRTARTRAYLIEVVGEVGAAEEVERHFAAATEELAGAPVVAADRAWVRTAYASARLALGQPRDAVQALDAPSVHAALEEAPLPGLLARRALGLALCACGEPRGHEILAASPFVHGRALEPHLAFLAHVNVMFEARERLREGAWNLDIAGRFGAALDRLPRHGELPRLFGNAPDRLRRSLPARPSLRTLERVLARCVRLS